ncbi:hypothetical protein J3R30DRAFT_3396325 [Lentinula aciculospora]|uniref:Uncharacterized protein n=1 Tax=Lentinula aciculospora TaxID=153920 RepID=A0A9W9DDK8_9AGAR|nr:hypothetical protein J3R30DRAFT_3396325 [Lentinula aciculospora]
MSASSPYGDYFRCRTIGRAASPPTWACYEQIPYDEDYSDSESEPCSEDDEDYHHASEDNECIKESEKEQTDYRLPADDSNDLDMDIDGNAEKSEGIEKKKRVETQKDVKGKQKAVEAETEPQPPKRHHRKKQRHDVYTLRPILTIQRSQGFVWNQDLFIPPYIKDRYVASTSPPNASGFISTSVSSTNSALTDYEVEVVEIRVQEGDLEHIIP